MVGKVTQGGPSRVLNMEDEDLLVKYLKYSASIG